MQKKREENGITLIALIVTMIVILILASVTIITLTGDNGLIKKASEAKETTEDAKKMEEIQLAIINIKSNENNTYEEKAMLLKEQLKNNDSNVETTVNTKNGDGILLKYYGLYYWIDSKDNIQKEQDVHGKNLLDIGEWKLVDGKDFWSNRKLEDSEHFWEREDDHIRTGYNTHRFVIRYSNEALINWSNYETITMKFKLINPLGGTMVISGLGYGKGVGINDYSLYGIGISNLGKSESDGLYEKTLQLKNIKNIPTMPTFVYWQNGVWYPGQTCEMELYEIRLD